MISISLSADVRSDCVLLAGATFTVLDLVVEAFFEQDDFDFPDLQQDFFVVLLAVVAFADFEQAVLDFVQAVLDLVHDLAVVVFAEAALAACGH